MVTTNVSPTHFTFHKLLLIYFELGPISYENRYSMHVMMELLFFSATISQLGICGEIVYVTQGQS